MTDLGSINQCHQIAQILGPKLFCPIKSKIYPLVWICNPDQREQQGDTEHPPRRNPAQREQQGDSERPPKVFQYSADICHLGAAISF